ncbi:hypothetical protein [Thioclava sp. GXIMD4215]|uniref:hypothetical protein n=1 Tax=Thioclava sp. GXIMD4215 TaxID=3131928 RepID=UPI003254FDB1
MMMADVRRDRIVAAGPRVMSVRSALEWAFGPENARMDFDHSGAHEFDRVGVSPEWRMMQQAKLGCRIDGGGAGPAPQIHPDAAMIAAAVEALELNPMFGREMAVLVATHARAGTAPDWRGSCVRRVVPMAWDFDRAGNPIALEAKGDIWWYRHPKCRNRLELTSKVCPIMYVGGGSDMAARRRRYLDWYGALLEVSMQLRVPGYLDTIHVTSALPALSPWQNSC